MIEKECPSCGKKFCTFKSQNQIFCCKECYSNYGRKLYTCACCGKQRIDKKCYSQKYKKWYCSKKCLIKDGSNPITAPYKNLSNTGRWKSWRKKVLRRDNFKCRMCNSKNHLEIHHIKSVKQCILDDDIDYIFDIENGVALCRNCHLLTDSWGYKNR